MRILIVDDESMVRNSMARMISGLEAEHILLEAEDGEDALLLVKEQPVDLVITDIRMPAMDGLELSSQLLAMDPELYIIMLTGHADFEYAQTALRNHVKDYMLKPASVDQIKQAIAKADSVIKARRAVEEVGKLREHNLLEKRLQDLFYELPLPYYDEGLFPEFTRFTLQSYMIKEGTARGKAGRFAVKNVIEDVLVPYGQPIVVVGEQLITAVLFQLKRGSVLPEASLLMDDVRRMVSQLLKWELSCGDGGEGEQLKELRRCYTRSREILGVPEPTDALETEKREDKMHHIIRAALERIEHKYAEEMSLTSLAEQLYVNPNYLSSLFKIQTGLTFTHHLTRTRMKKAKSLLRETTLKIYEICEQVGYTDQAHFSRVFKALESISPYEYRATAKTEK
jgi:two-component system response regulator YesN